MTLRNPQGLSAKRLVLLGVGKADSFDALAQNDAFVGLGKMLKGLPITEATLDIASLTRGDRWQERLGHGIVGRPTNAPQPNRNPPTMMQVLGLTVIGSDSDQVYHHRDDNRSGRNVTHELAIFLLTLTPAISQTKQTTS